MQRRDEEMRLIKTTGLVLISSLALAGCASSVEQEPQILDSDAASIQVEANQNATSDAAAENESSETDPEQQQDQSENLSAAEPMSEEEIILAALMGPDGEYAALASYQAVLDEYGLVEPYATILNAESRHADALIRQLERLGLEVPENPYLGTIAAPADLQSAAEAWAEGEILNIELYDYLITQTDDSQLLKVLNNLRSASLDSHLPAFQAAAENGGTLDDMQSSGSRG